MLGIEKAAVLPDSDVLRDADRVALVPRNRRAVGGRLTELTAAVLEAGQQLGAIADVERRACVAESLTGGDRPIDRASRAVPVPAHTTTRECSARRPRQRTSTVPQAVERSEMTSSFTSASPSSRVRAAIAARTRIAPPASSSMAGPS